MALDHLLAGAEVEMVGVAEDDLGTGAAHVAGIETADHAVGAHRHECGGLDRRRAAGSACRRARGAGGGLDGELEH